MRRVRNLVRTFRFSVPNLAGVKSVVAVASAKGGVGKSALTANLAAVLALAGRKVAILDADLNSPSVVGMLGMKVPRRFHSIGGIEPGAGPLGLRIAASNLIPDGDAPPVTSWTMRPRRRNHPPTVTARWSWVMPPRCDGCSPRPASVR